MTWTITVFSGDLGAASKFAAKKYPNVPYTPDTTYTGTYHECLTMAGFIRSLIADSCGYDPVRWDREGYKITYYIMPHFGMPKSTLLEFKNDNFC